MEYYQQLAMHPLGQIVNPNKGSWFGFYVIPCFIASEHFSIRIGNVELFLTFKSDNHSSIRKIVA